MFPHFRPSVSLSHTHRSTSPGETKLLASEIYEILQLAGKEEAEQAEAAAASCQRKAQFFLGSNNKRAKTVVLHIDGLDDSVSVQRDALRSDTTARLLMRSDLLLFFGPLLWRLSVFGGFSAAARPPGEGGSGWKCQPLNSRAWRLNPNAALRDARV